MGGFGAMIARAFKWHWNLLFLGAGAAFAFLSGNPDLVLPLVAAGEVLYLGALGTNGRFQSVLTGRKMLKEKESGPKARLAQLLEFLSAEDQERFSGLQLRCHSMMQLRRKMNSEASPAGETDFRAESLDKLLWLFLRLLHHKSGLERFLRHTSREDLATQLEKAKAQLEEVKQKQSSERLVESIREKTTTIEDRLSNYGRAEENLEIIGAELDKTEQKIAHICEVGMTSRDGSELSFQIDGITQGIAVSQQALADLRVDDIFEGETPSLLSGEYEEAPVTSLLEMER